MADIFDLAKGGRKSTATQPAKQDIFGLAKQIPQPAQNATAQPAPAATPKASPFRQWLQTLYDMGENVDPNAGYATDDFSYEQIYNPKSVKPARPAITEEGAAPRSIRPNRALEDIRAQNVEDGAGEAGRFSTQPETQRTPRPRETVEERRAAIFEEGAYRPAETEPSAQKQGDSKRAELENAVAEAEAAYKQLADQDKTWWGPMDWDNFNRSELAVGTAKKALEAYDLEALTTSGDLTEKTPWADAKASYDALVSLDSEVTRAVFADDGSYEGLKAQYDEDLADFTKKPDRYSLDNIDEWAKRAYYLSTMPAKNWTDEEKAEAEAIVALLQAPSLFNGFSGEYNTALAQGNASEWMFMDEVLRNLQNRLHPNLLGAVTGFMRGTGATSLAATVNEATGGAMDDSFSNLYANEAFANEKGGVGSFIGQTAGSIAAISGIGEISRGVFAATKLPALAKALVSGATTFAAFTGVQDLGYLASGDISLEQYLKEMGISGAAGLAGAGASRGMAAAGISLLRATGLAGNNLANALLAGMVGAAFAGGDTSVRTIAGMLEYGDKYEIDEKEIAKSVLVAMAFGAIDYALSGVGSRGAEEVPAADVEPSSKYFNRDMTKEEMKAALRRYVKQYHPDLHPGDAEAARIMSEINAEYKARLKWNARTAAQTGAEAHAEKARAESRGDTAAAAEADQAMQDAIRTLEAYAGEDSSIMTPEVQDALDILTNLSGEQAAPTAAEGAVAAQTIPDVIELGAPAEPTEETSTAYDQWKQQIDELEGEQPTAEIAPVQAEPEQPKPVSSPAARTATEDDGRGNPKPSPRRTAEERKAAAKAAYEQERHQLEQQSEERQTYLEEKRQEHADLLDSLEKGDKVYIDGEETPAFEVTEKTEDGMTILHYDADGEIANMERVLPDSFTGDTTISIIEGAESIGVNEPKAIAQKSGDSIMDVVPEKPPKPWKKGTVTAENVKLSDLRRKFNDTQNTSYRLLTGYAEMSGVDIVLFESQPDANGEFPAEQGRFQWKDDKIYIDINSGLLDSGDVRDLGKYVMLRTFGHEFSHFIEKWNEKGYNSFRKVLFDTMKNRGEDVDALVKQTQKNYGGISADAASREVVADAMSDVLPDSKFAHRLAERHPTVFNQIRKKLRDFLGRLKQLYRRIRGTSPREARVLKENGEYLQEIVDMYDEIAVEAVENYQRAQGYTAAEPVEKKPAETKPAEKKEEPKPEPKAEPKQEETKPAEEVEAAAEELPAEPTVEEVLEADAESAKPVEPVPTKAETEKAKAKLKKGVSVPIEKRNADAIRHGLVTEQLDIGNITLTGTVQGFNVEQRAHLIQELIQAYYAGKQYAKISVPYDGKFTIEATLDNVVNILATLKAKVTQDVIFNKKLDSIIKKQGAAYTVKNGDTVYIGTGSWLIPISQEAADYAATADGYKAAPRNLQGGMEQIFGGGYSTIEKAPEEVTTKPNGKYFRFQIDGKEAYFDPDIVKYLDGNKLEAKRFTISFLSGKTMEFGAIRAVDDDGNVAGYILETKLNSNTSVQTALPTKLKSFSGKPVKSATKPAQKAEAPKPEERKQSPFESGEIYAKDAVEKVTGSKAASDIVSKMPAAEEKPQATAPEPEKSKSRFPLLQWKRGTPSQKAAYRILMDYLRQDKGMPSKALYEICDEAFGGTQSDGTYNRKDAYDAMELAVNQYITETMRGYNTGTIENAQRGVEFAQRLLDRLPTQTVRTQEQLDFQQFSTPPSIAYLTAWAANITAGDHVMEPSAGIGGLAAFAKAWGAEVTVNELSERRYGIIQAMGFDHYFNENAEHINNILPDDIQPTVVIMNPPFSATAGRTKSNKTSNAELHINSALDRLEDNGRLVAVVGRGMADDKYSKYWDKLRQEYTIRANIGIDGKNYTKYGTSFDVQIVVIDKVGPQGDVQTVTGRFEDLSEIPAVMEGIRNDRSTEVERKPAVAGASEAVAAEREEGQPVRAAVDQANALDSGRAEPGDRIDAGRGGESGSIDVQRADGSEKGIRSSGSGERGAVEQQRPGKKSPAGRKPKGEVSGLRSDAGTVGAAADVQGKPGQQRDNAKPEPARGGQVSADPVTDDGVFTGYKAPALTVKGSKPHPAVLVESAAMGAVDMPKATYTPHLPENVIRNNLSTEQLVSVTYAGQAHEQTLPSGERRGFFIGDGTGVGKGRTISGIILDNFEQGRDKAIWISEKQSLFNDAQRDWTQTTERSKDEVQSLSKVKVDDKISFPNGIVYTTYDTLRGGSKTKSRVEQLAEWFGKDYDGVIAFDEAHNMGNLLGRTGKFGKSKGSAKAAAAVELQRLLPNARVVYVSATAATEVDGLAFASRLGLWGKGTAFTDVKDFVSKIGSSGLSAMELVIRDMKAMGMYVARSISYNGVQYETIQHNLDPIQREIYNTMSRAWQKTMTSVTDSLASTGAQFNSQAKSLAVGQYYSAIQRFYNQVLTSMSMPSVIADMKKQLADGRSCVLQIVNTNQAEADRQMATIKAEGGELDDMDLTPRGTLINYLEECYPIYLYEEYMDDNGNLRSRPVVDSKNEPVIDKKAVAKRDALIAEINEMSIPDGPLEMLFDAFGTENVAEITGRTRRVVPRKQPDGSITRVEERRTANSKEADVNAFQNGDKRILVFNNAGGTGKSYHADLKAKNQQQRVHYVLQPGWEASRAVQGFGRTHRSNEASAPIYKLVTTDIKGQKRFTSTIARRLDQLGALTKGQRDTGSGMFGASDNLETDLAKDALREFYRRLGKGQLEGINGMKVLEKLGLREKFTGEYGEFKLNDAISRDISKFLNRILALEVDEQNQVFDAFISIYEAEMDAAIQSGTLDRGMENIKADKIEIVDDKIIQQQEGTGAATHYVQAKVFTKPKVITTVAEAESARAGFAGIYKTKDGDVRAVYRIADKTTEWGAIVKQYKLQSPNRAKSNVWQERTLNANADLLPKSEWQSAWDEELKKVPEYNEEVKHMLTGSLLPIWDTLPQEGNTKVQRLITDDGKAYLGRIINQDQIDTVLRRFNVNRTKETFTGAGVMKKALESSTVFNLTYYRAKIFRSRVSGEWRLEYEQPQNAWAISRQYPEMIMERISYQNRYFIPTGKAGEALLDKILEANPVANTSERKDDEQYSLRKPQPAPEPSDRVQYSLRAVPPAVPASDKWQSGHSEAWFQENEFPIREDVSEEWLKARIAKGWTEGKKPLNKKGFSGNVKLEGTQIKSTESTYKKIFEHLKGTYPDTWRTMRVLDASSGLGLGTKAGLEMGFDVTDIEPYVHPDSDYFPDYMDYSSLQSKVQSGEVKPYDFIISNAVLNVIPQDTRDNMVDWFGSVLAPGGQLYVNTLDANYNKTATTEIIRDKNGKIINTVLTQSGNFSKTGPRRGNETYVGRSQSVQKGFDSKELRAYLADALGSGYRVDAPDFDAGSGATALVTKFGTPDAAIVQYSRRPLTQSEQKYYDTNKKRTKTGQNLYTLQGSPTGRYKGNVGKQVGDQIYLHKNYALEVIPENVYRQSLDILRSTYPDFHFNCLMYEAKKNTVRFDEAPDFDIAREPIPGKTVSVNYETGDVKTGSSEKIWHHKWEWVKNDYTGFDVDAAWNWSKQFLSAIRKVDESEHVFQYRFNQRGIANGTSNGYDAWNEQLRYFGLPTDMDTTEESVRRPHMSNQEVLTLAADRIDTDALTDAQKNALAAFQEKLGKLEEAQGQRAELGRQYKQEQFTKGGSREEAGKIKARMELMDNRIHRLENELVSLEDKDVLRGVLNEARKVVETEERKYGDETLKQYRERRTASEATRKYRGRVRAQVLEFADLMTKPSNKDIRKHVPAEIQKTLVDFLDSINLSSKTMLATSGLETTKADEKYLKSMKKLHDAIKENVDMQGLYSGYSDLPPDFLDNFEALIRKAEEMIEKHSGTFIINQMNGAELKELSKTLRTLKKFITTMNTFHNNAMFQHVDEAGDSTVAHLARFGKSESSGSVYKFLRFDYMRPSLAFEHFGEGGKSIEHEFRAGQATQAMLADTVIDFSKNTFNGKEVKLWSENVKEFTLSGGEKISLPVTHIMSLYCLNKRAQAQTHIYGDGIRVANYKANGKVQLDDGHIVSTEDVQKMIDSLTPRQIEVADALQKFMSTECAQWGNYVSIARFDVEQFTEPNYFPINSDGRYLPATADESPDNAGLYALLNMGFTKELKENAKNRIILYNVFDVFANHAASMTQYRSFALPVLDALKWFNYKDDVTSVRDQLARAFGAPEETRAGSGSKGYAESFVINLIRAYNGTAAQGDPYDAGGLKALHRFNRAQIAFNLRVVAQQPMAITRAAMILDAGQLMKSLAKGATKANAEEMERYSGIAKWKSFGFFDTNISRGLTELIKQTPTVGERVTEAGTKGAELADRYTWAAIWDACKNTVKRGNYTTEEAYFQAVTELFEDVIYKTQVVDSVLTKSEFMRAKGFFPRMMGSFMSEPMTTTSMLTDAYYKYQDDRQTGSSRSEAWKKNAKNIRRTFVVYAVGQVMLAAAQAFMDAWRDEDEYDEEHWFSNYFQKWLNAFKSNVIEEMLPFGKIPYVSEMYEISKQLLDYAGVFDKWGLDLYGNDISNGWAQYAKYLIKGSEILIDKARGEKTNYTGWGAVYNLMRATSGLIGYPFATFTREVIDAWNNTVGYFAPSMAIKTYESALDRKYDETMRGTGVSKAQYEKILSEADVDGEWASPSQDELGTYLQDAIKAGTVTKAQADAVWASRGWKPDHDLNWWAEKQKSVPKTATGAVDPAYADYKKNVSIYDKDGAYEGWKANLEQWGVGLDEFTNVINKANTDGNTSLRQDELGEYLYNQIQNKRMTEEEANAWFLVFWNGQRSKTYTKWAAKYHP